jgi:uncharacterized repeat protein (TIGR02543 family)
MPRKSFSGAICVILAITVAGCANVSGGNDASDPVVATPVVASYAVSFDSQGGSAVSGVTALSGGKLTSPTAPTKTGYVFDGWYNEAGCVHAWSFDVDTVTSDLTLFAKWLPIPSVTAIPSALSITGVPADKTLSLSESWTLEAVVAGADAFTEYAWTDLSNSAFIGNEKSVTVRGSAFSDTGKQWLYVTAKVGTVTYSATVELTVVRD